MRYSGIVLLALVGFVFCVDPPTEDPNCQDLDPSCSLIKKADCSNKDFGDKISQKCPKTCDTCYVTTIEPTAEAPCEDGTLIDCAANIAKCGKADLMKTLCPATCGLCGTTAGPTPAPCRDDPTVDCASMKAACKNEQYQGILTVFCPVTCGFCGKQAM